MDRCLPVGLRPKKRFGQNFLVDEKVVADLVAAANLTKSDVVVEIGAGTGILTQELAKSAGKVLAFEIDHDLIPVLQKNLSEFDNVEVINEDFLKSSPTRYAETPRRGVSAVALKIVGSIPYQITSPLIHKLLMLEPKPMLVVLLIQKEVAEKITAKPPKATYLSNIVQLLGEVKIIRSVSKNAFWPVPEVAGAIVKIDCSCAPMARPLNLEGFQKFLHQGFQHPRKMLRNKFDPEILKSAGIDPTKRAQTLELDEWVKLFNHLNN